MAVRRRSPSKVRSPRWLAIELRRLRRLGKRIVLTNGCFDLLHPGHVRTLRAAKRLGDVLVVALNDDASVRRLKGPGRPLLSVADRCEIVAALEMVDYVTTFAEDTPRQIIRLLEPDVLAKGGDWAVDRIAGADLVHARGGRVRSLPYTEGYSTTRLVRRIARLATGRRSVKVGIRFTGKEDLDS